MLNAREEELANTASTELGAKDLPSESELEITHDSLCELLGIPETRWSLAE